MEDFRWEHTKVARVGERSICDNFTKFNSRTVNGPFLSDTGINQEVSGGCWIWVVVLFTHDWLASQNHQIHLPTVTFMRVIFKVTATCLVSRRWPPHLCLHLLPLLPLPSSSLILSLTLQLHLLCLPSSPPFNYFCLTFFGLCSPSLGWAGWEEQGHGGVKADRKKRRK